MDKKDVMQQARKFAEKSLQGSIEKVEKKDYFMFLISRFLLLKETIIRKDSDNNTLYFDYKRHKDYLPIIIDIVNHIKSNGRIELNSTTVVITPKEYDDPSLHFYIWSFNKIRDSFSHGMYTFDIEKEQIVINNDHSEEKDPYVLSGTLPIRLLEIFYYIFPKRKQDFGEKYMKELEEQIEAERRRFFGQKAYNVEELTKYDNPDYREKLEINYYGDILYHNIQDLSIINNTTYHKTKKGYVHNINYHDIKEFSKKQEDILDILLAIIRNGDMLDEEQRKVVIEYFKRLKILDETDKSLIPRVKKNKHPDEEYANKLAAVINEMTSIIGINPTQSNLITVASLYNYMQLTFALKDFDFKNKDKRKPFGYLNMRKLHPMYVKTNATLFEENFNSQYSIKLKAIQNYTDIFILRLKEKLEHYKQNPSPRFRDSINEYFKKFYEEIIDSFADKNAFLLTSIRNSIEHANFFDFNGSIILNDQSNQNDNTTINFACYGTASDYFEITNCLEMGNAEERFTFDDFLEELKTVIETRTFNELIDVINQLKLINQEALISVLNQSMSR